MNIVETMKALPFYPELERRHQLFQRRVDEHCATQRHGSQVDIERDAPELAVPGIMLGNLNKAAKRLDDLLAERVRPDEKEGYAQRVAEARRALDALCESAINWVCDAEITEKATHDAI